MSQTLYRKYRPQKFSDVVGQDHVTITLTNQIKNNQIAHAYLFTGPRGVGKTTTARLLAQAVQAHKLETGEPDTTSEVVKSMMEGRSLDLVEIDAASNRRIEEVRELREHVKYPPNQAKFKVFIIDEVHMLTTEAFNALLKTLEEPPAFVIFVLATTELHKLPDTIISRCQRFDFKPVSYSVLEKRLVKLATLEKKKVAPSVIATIVRLSEGCVRDAESLLGQVLSLGKEEVTEEDARIFLPEANTDQLERFWNSIVAAESKQGMEVLQELAMSGSDIAFFFDEWLEVIRQALLWKIDPGAKHPSLVLDETLVAAVQSGLEKLSLQDVHFILNTFLEYRSKVSVTAVPVLPLELALIACCLHLQKTPPPQSGSRSDAEQPEPDAHAPPENIEQRVQEEITTSTRPVDDLISAWREVLGRIEKKNPGLFHYLQAAKASRSADGLQITLAHSFHYEILKKPTNSNLVQKLLKEITGKIVQVDLIVGEVQQQASAHEVPSVDSLAEAFGGVVVE